MELTKIHERQSYLNIDMMNNYMMAFDIALSKKFIDKKYFIDNMMFIEATNSSDPKNPNTLLFKDSITRESFRINY
jgi:hypothetical protein